MDDWILRQTGPVTYLTLPHWEAEGVDLAFTTRTGGVSQGNFQSLNLGLHVGDQEEAVLENRRRTAALFGAGLESMVCCQQVHGSEVTVVGLADRGRGAYRLEEAIPGYDGMVTAEPGVYLLSFYADCVPVYFFDPIHRVAATAHCGWKGTMARITENTLQVMNQKFGTAADTVWIFIGPGIGTSCFAVGADLADRVNAEFPGWPGITSRCGDNHYWDLQQTNARILEAVGVRSQNISTCRLCTACHPELFFSFRRDLGETGRMAALLGLHH